MDTMLFHIGYHKTATTWLQNELFTTRSGVFIPISEKESGHSTLAKDFIYSKDGYLLSSFCLNEKMIRFSLNKILKGKILNDEKIPVISHERLSGNPHSSGFDSYIISKRIYKLFPHAKILIVIREQSSWILSNYFQYLSIGGTDSLKKYLEIRYDGKRPGFSPYHLEYHHLIKNYQSKFGEENVLVVPYEVLRKDKKLFFKKLCDFLELESSCFNHINGDKLYNIKNNYFVDYRFRLFNLIISPSSVNSNLNLNSKFLRSLIVRMKFLFTMCVPNRFNELTLEKLSKEINQWSNNRFNNSNDLTQDLINVNLTELGYQTNACSIKN